MRKFIVPVIFAFLLLITGIHNLVLSGKCAKLQQELIRAGVLPEDYDFESHKKLVPMQAGDVPVTYADTSALERDFGFKPSTSLREGLRRFAQWYKVFYMEGDA